jgi:hypothetical protein
LWHWQENFVTGHFCFNGTQASEFDGTFRHFRRDQKTHLISSSKKETLPVGGFFVLKQTPEISFRLKA